MGFLLGFDPGDRADHMGRLLGLSGEALRGVIYMDSAAVLPSHRGRGIQRGLLERAEWQLRAAGEKRWLMATVSPDNPWSAANFMALGYRRLCTVEKYGGLMRDVWVKALEAGDGRPAREGGAFP